MFTVPVFGDRDGGGEGGGLGPMLSYPQHITKPKLLSYYNIEVCELVCLRYHCEKINMLPLKRIGAVMTTVLFTS